jgi:O-methyltransferase
MKACLEKLAPAVSAYADAHSSPPSGLLLDLERETTVTEGRLMHSGRSVGRLLKLLVAALRPTLAVDVGTFTGNSALCIAEGLPAHGKVITLEVSEERAAFARRYFDLSPYRDRIDLRVGRALDTLRTIDTPIGFAFIDADKGEYWDYYDAIIERLSPTGLIAVDNTLFLGLPFLEESEVASLPPPLRALRGSTIEFNRRVHDDPRAETCMLTVRDGITLIRRRSDGH